jgi:flap endonuclease-1
MIDDAKKVLTLLGIPHVQAPQEGEAQAAHIAIQGHAWAANSRDYDSVLFGAPRLVRYVTISGQEFLPSKGVSRPLIPEMIELQGLLLALGITREQLVDLAILVGTDFNDGIRGVGPKTALRLIKEHNNLEYLPQDVRDRLPGNVNEVRQIFLKPVIVDNYETSFGKLDESGLREFLCAGRNFSQERVDLAVRRMKEFYAREHSSLQSWLGKNSS